MCPQLPPTPYHDPDEPLEVVTCHIQMLFHSFAGHDWIGRMVRDDPAMVDLLLVGGGAAVLRLLTRGTYVAMRHEIVRLDRMRGREPRRIVWDDHGGTVEGDHFDVPLLQSLLEKPTPLVIDDVPGSLTLRNPAHGAADFLALLALYVDGSLDQPPLPEALRGIGPTPFELHDLPPGSVA